MKIAFQAAEAGSESFAGHKLLEAALGSRVFLQGGDDPETRLGDVEQLHKNVREIHGSIEMEVAMIPIVERGDEELDGRGPIAGVDGGDSAPKTHFGKVTTLRKSPLVVVQCGKG